MSNQEPVEAERVAPVSTVVARQPANYVPGIFGRSIVILAPVLISVIVMLIPQVGASKVPGINLDVASLRGRAEGIAAIFGFFGAVLQFLPNLLEGDADLIPWHPSTTAFVKAVGFAFIAAAFLLLLWSNVAALGNIQTARLIAVLMALLLLATILIIAMVRRSAVPTPPTV